MSRPIGTYDIIAIVQLVLYFLFLGIAIFLSVKHGFTKSAGWRYLIVLALARIIGSCLYLATISDPTNWHLYVGWYIVNGLGLGPLVLVLLGLLSRVFESINRQGHVVLKPLYQRLIQILMLVAIILIIVGGTNSNFNTQNGVITSVEYAQESKVGTGLMIAVIVLLCLETLLAYRNQGFVAQGEHRIILGVIASMPFVIIRLVYSCLLILGGVKSTKWLYLGLEVIMEIVVVIIVETLGLTLDKASEVPTQPNAEYDLESNPQLLRK